jgi:hypothetical protein
MNQAGDCVPERMFVAVRAMAPVAGSSPKSSGTIFATPCPQFDVGIVPVIVHAIGNYG